MRIPHNPESKLNKITGFAIFANAIQILCALGILAHALFSESLVLSEYAESTLVGIAAFFVIWGAIVDIRDAYIMRRAELQRRMLEEAYGQLEDLNQTLRRQRHDFKNHLQVVYTLTEMESYPDVQEYIQNIYEDVQSVGNMLRTAVPAVNALLSAKSADCKERHIDFIADIQSAWEDIPVAGWELCRIIGNLVDNAIDALEESRTPDAAIHVRIGESISDWNLSVENNGPSIPAEHKKSIFLPGFTTKSAGHGNGLSIVSELVNNYNGELTLESETGRTVFCCMFPKTKNTDIG